MSDDRPMILMSVCIACTVYLAMHNRFLRQMVRHRDEAMSRQFMTFRDAIERRDRLAGTRRRRTSDAYVGGDWIAPSLREQDSQP